VTARAVPTLRSPVRLLVFGLSLVLLAIAGFGAYAISQIRALGEEQTAISERNRKGSLQLLRIQNDLASLGTTMRDMADRTEPYPMTAWKPAFDRIRHDLQQALVAERELAPVDREPAQQARLEQTMQAYWQTVDRVFAQAATDEAAASATIRGTLTRQHQELVDLVSRLLVANNRVQEEAARANRAIYDRVVRGILTLVAALVAIIAAAGVWVIMASGRAFREVRALTAQLRSLSWRSLRMQEDLQRAVSRELHDDFGQTVTAIGALLVRARRTLPPDAPLLAELDEVRQVTQDALDRIRTRSQWLHPGVLDDFGLERALARYVEQFERQQDIRVHFETAGGLDDVPAELAIHVYRIVQEALSNVSRHAGAREAWVRLARKGNELDLQVEDRGVGLVTAARAARGEPGIGLVTMRERAELMGGTLTLTPPPGGGLLVHVQVPLHRTDADPRRGLRSESIEDANA
jgi:signal transduction histidine kinase